MSNPACPIIEYVQYVIVTFNNNRRSLLYKFITRTTELTTEMVVKYVEETENCDRYVNIRTVEFLHFPLEVKL
jgi:hypothetical protein